MVVENDQDLQELIILAGEKRSYRMIPAGNGLEAKKVIEGGEIPSLIILDINMPGMDGFVFCRWLREDHPMIPVIFLSSRTEEYDRILALEIGGDDYLTKPFSMKELFVRAAVSLRRIKLYASSRNETARIKKPERVGLIIETDSWTCSYMGKELLLTVSEFRILNKLAGNPNIVLSRDKLARAAFPEDLYNTGRSVDIHIHRLRYKLRTINPDFDGIQTVFQVGYKWTE